MFEYYIAKAQLALARFALLKGDKPGHPFYGNQYTDARRAEWDDLQANWGKLPKEEWEARWKSFSQEERDYFNANDVGMGWRQTDRAAAIDKTHPNPKGSYELRWHSGDEWDTMTSGTPDELRQAIRDQQKLVAAVAEKDGPLPPQKYYLITYDGREVYDWSEDAERFIWNKKEVTTDEQDKAFREAVQRAGEVKQMELKALKESSQKMQDRIKVFRDMLARKMRGD